MRNKKPAYVIIVDEDGQFQLCEVKPSVKKESWKALIALLSKRLPKDNGN